MPFGVVSGIGLGMGVLGEVWGVNLRRPIITNGDFVASLCGSAYSDRAVVWRGEWGEHRHSCVRWEVHVPQGEGSVSGMICGIFWHLGMPWFP